MHRFVRLAIAGLVFCYAVIAPLPGYTEEGEKQVAHLYFADAKKPFLVGEERVLIDSGDPAVYARQIVQELINGPAGGKWATIPRGTRLRSFFLLEDGTAVVDFSNHFRKNHPGSCRLEQLTLFSVVNSLVLNVPAIDRVKILIDGAETETLAGHVALEFPLTADMLLTR
ncbi:GerMN domain-containing protein [uncultured Desulfosarcina sp.]|uniref:GerMN domain-containing protein n=1 Tax=uncultured Desulfosarcina sp. TaxID=218289 RepID=UPI0029C7BC03|nr:GerMN domain-containing protein [uncultured Desulfosarcina sp.]